MKVFADPLLVDDDSSETSVEPSDDDAAHHARGLRPSYRYQPLAHGEIRVLVLLEADHFLDDIECALLKLPLSHFTSIEGDDADSFTALSYVWGQRRQKYPVYIDDKTLYVSRNLESALRYLRRRDRHMLLWVDAICINQSDLSERNDQVQQMRDIFECAHETIAYIGDHDEGNIANSAWNFLERQSAWALNENLEQDSTIPKQREDQVHFRGDLHDVYYTVLTKEWFKRVWVFQEAVVSKRLSLQSRHRRVPWDDFIRCTILQDRTHDRYGQSLAQASGFDFVRQLWHARVSFHAARDQEQYLPAWYAQHMDPVHDNLSTDMLSMLVLARRRKASDARDKVFALLGVSTGFDWQSNGTVDYGKTMAEVFKDFAIDYMTTKKDYRALSYLNRTSTAGFSYQQVRRWRAARQSLLKAAEDNAATGLSEEDVNALETRDGYSLLVAEELTQQIPMQSEWLKLEDVSEGPSQGFLEPAAQTCSRRLDELEGDLSEYGESDHVHLPTWVPNWDCRNQMNNEPRAIIEIADPAKIPGPTTDAGSETAEQGINVESYRTWTNSYTLGPRSVPRGTLAVQGRVLGKVVKSLASTSLLGRDESMFCELLSAWKAKQDHLAFPLEAYVLSLWTKLLRQTSLVEQTDTENVGQLSPELFRRAFFDIGKELSTNPYKCLLEHFDMDALPPKPRSIEALLIERAETGTDWSADSVASQRIVPASKSVLDQRLLGLYRGTKLSPRYEHPRDILLHERYRARMGVGLGPEKLVLLPQEAKFGDLVVLFPGAKVPFLVRQKMITGMEHWSTRKLHRGNLPHLETAKLFIECALIGECWVNEFEDIGNEAKVFDTVFSVQ